MTIRMTPEAIAARVRIGRTVRIFMEIRGKSVGDLEQVLGVSDQQVRDRLRGKCNIPAQELAVLSEYLDIAPGEFFRDPDDLVNRHFRCNPGMDGTGHWSSDGGSTQIAM